LKHIIERHEAYLKKKFNLADEINRYLERIKKYQDLNAFIQVYAEEALEQAHIEVHVLLAFWRILFRPIIQLWLNEFWKPMV